MSTREPVLDPTPLASLRPTQIAVGFREVAEKRRLWRDRADAEGNAFLGRHLIPAVRGPKGHLYLTDHHHLCLALLQEGVEHVLVDIQADLHSQDKDAFWVFLDNKNWCHPYDGEGRRRDFDAIPKSLTKLADDPYRSLAGELRRAGGFAKDPNPFSEFLWADFLRRRVKVKLVTDDFPAALTRALTLAKSRDTAYLPGWCGPNPAG